VPIPASQSPSVSFRMDRSEVDRLMEATRWQAEVKAEIKAINDELARNKERDAAEADACANTHKDHGDRLVVLEDALKQARWTFRAVNSAWGIAIVLLGIAIKLGWL